MSKWEVKRLDEVAERIAVKNAAGHQRVLTVAAGYGLIDQQTYFNKRVASADLSGYWVVEPGDFVYNKSTSKDSPWGVIARWDGDEPAVVTSLYIVFRARPGVDPDYLLHACNGTFFFDSLRGKLREGARAHGLLNVRLAEFFGAQLVIPLPAEQRRIVDVAATVDAQIAALDEESQRAWATWQAAVADLDQYDDRLRLSEGLHSIEAGKSPKGQERVPGPDERAVLKISAVGRARFVPAEVKTVDDSTSLPEATKVQRGDVLLVRCNAVLDRVGTVCRVNEEPHNLYLCDKTLRLVADDRVLLPNYLVHAMATPSVRHQIARLTAGSDMRNIGQKALRQLAIPDPGVDAQARLAAGLDELISEALAVESEVSRLRTFRSTLLTSLFSQEIEIPGSYDALLQEVS